MALERAWRIAETKTNYHKYPVKWQKCDVPTRTLLSLNLLAYIGISLTQVSSFGTLNLLKYLQFVITKYCLLYMFNFTTRQSFLFCSYQASLNCILSRPKWIVWVKQIATSNLDSILKYSIEYKLITVENLDSTFITIILHFCIGCTAMSFCILKYHLFVTLYTFFQPQDCIILYWILMPWSIFFLHSETTIMQGLLCSWVLVLGGFHLP